jgi:hypothetical protein
MIVRQSEIAAFREAILDAKVVKIEFDVLWELWNRAAPRFTGDPGQAAALKDALVELSGSLVIELPKQAWDKSTVPLCHATFSFRPHGARATSGPG